MANYSKEEIKSFAQKDLRISKLAMIKSLIEKLPLEDIYEVKKVTELVEKYIDYVYMERQIQSERSAKRGNVGCATDNTKPDWGKIAWGLNLAIPNSQNIKILNLIVDEYKKAYKASANPKDIIAHILNTFGTYPTKTESVKKVIQSLTQN